ncbi:hypothetical protein RND71_014949 [Anisodus tanguticus]|uniref:Coatomer subunit zeta n=1 Tax=Anisodus tanguticus TaxID=243964 RepID=A0AAE1SCL1_9SOLA|nr:hypothetical protein RND71_014949 [Anisodus tanguticus]
MRQGQIPQHAEFLRACGKSNSRLSEVIYVITSTVRDACGKPPSERLFLDKYGNFCLCLDEIVSKGLLENTEKDRITRLMRLKPPSEF